MVSESGMNLRKLNRRELLEIMLAQSREIDALREEIKQLSEELEDKTLKTKNAGSIAEDSLQVTQVFEEAQKSADLYIANVRRRTDEESARHIRRVREETRKAARLYLEELQRKADSSLEEYRQSLKERLAQEQQKEKEQEKPEDESEEKLSALPAGLFA